MLEKETLVNSTVSVTRSTPIWAAVHTPFLESGSLDIQGLRHNVRSYIATGLNGVFCNGLMGEVWALDLNERKQILETIIDESEGRLGVSVVVSASSLADTLELGIHAKNVGATHAVLMMPSSGPRSDQQLINYFQYICEQLDMPIVIFNAATAAGSLLKADVFSRLCELPNLKILKTTASKAENEVFRRAARNGVLVSDPLEEHFLLNMHDHAQSILYADPEPYLYQNQYNRPIDEYVASMEAGETDLAFKKYQSLSLKRVIFNKWIMDPLKQGHMPNAALKHWCELIGLVGGSVRAPILPLNDYEIQELEGDLARCGLIESTRN